MTITQHRFSGTGDTKLITGHMGWEVRCCRCGAMETISNNRNNHMFSPDVIEKRLKQSGWVLSKDGKDDVCSTCNRPKTKNEQNVIDIEYKTSDTAAFFKQIRACLMNAKQAANAKQHNKTGQYIDAALKGIDYATDHMVLRRKAKHEPEVVQDPNFNSWLEEIDKKHKEGK